MQQQKKIVKKVPSKSVQSKESFIDKLKSNWKNIVLILLVLFSVNKCTSSCTRGKQIDKLEYQVVQLDSVITSNGIEIDKLNIQLDNAKTTIDSYKGIATGNQKDLVDKVSELTEENKTLKQKVNVLTKERDTLTERVKELENKEAE